MEDDLNLKKIEDNLNFKANGRQPQAMLAWLALASPGLGTAQPQLVSIVVCLYFHPHFACTVFLNVKRCFIHI